MAIPNKQIGWSNESNLLQQISKQLERLTSVTSKISADGYLKYIALLSQSGTNPPVSTVLENTIGNIVWAYEGLGQYSGTIPNFIQGKVVVFYGAGTIGDKSYVVQAYVNNYPPYGVWIDTSDSSTGLSIDDVLAETPIEIRVYP